MELYLENNKKERLRFLINKNKKARKKERVKEIKIFMLLMTTLQILTIWGLMSATTLR